MRAVRGNGYDGQPNREHGGKDAHFLTCGIGVVSVFVMALAFHEIFLGNLVAERDSDQMGIARRRLDLHDDFIVQPQAVKKHLVGTCRQLEMQRRRITAMVCSFGSQHNLHHRVVAGDILCEALVWPKRGQHLRPGVARRPHVGSLWRTTA